jgi:hypothetical protein
MRGPDFETDGWCLEDGEARHAEAPATFQIPPIGERERLAPGDLAKLIFRIALDGQEEPAFERMWVLVRERAGGAYLGLLDNDPAAIAENDALWSGVELPFAPRHVIDIRPGDAASRAAAAREPRRRWGRE